MQACPKVTGKRGIQIWVPVAAGYALTIRTVGERLVTSGDPLAPLVAVQQRLTSL